jgi:hypothetical protein
MCCEHICSHGGTHSHMKSLVRTHPHTHTQTCTHNHKHRRSHAHTHTHAHTHALTHTHKHHTHTTHTHIRARARLTRSLSEAELRRSLTAKRFSAAAALAVPSASSSSPARSTSWPSSTSSSCTKDARNTRPNCARMRDHREPALIERGHEAFNRSIMNAFHILTIKTRCSSHWLRTQQQTQRTWPMAMGLTGTRHSRGMCRRRRYAGTSKPQGS